MRLVKACIAMAAFAALFVVPSMASASPVLTHPTGTAAPVGTKILATNVAHANTSVITKMTTPGGNVECATATITGEIKTNSGTHILGTITTAEFRSTPGTNHTESHCTAPGGLGKVTVTPNHTVNPCHTPSGGTSHCSLPWCITASNLNDEFEVFADTDGKCEEKGKLTFTLDSTIVGACSYEKEKPVIGTYTTDKSPEFSDAILTIKDQEFKKITGSAFCPATGKLDMAFTLATDENEKSGTAIYIS